MRPTPGEGRVAALFVAPAAGRPVLSIDEVRATPGRGLRGDRYAEGTGHWSGDRSDEVTLIDEGRVAELRDLLGVEVEARLLRRNVLTRGVRLDELIGRRFRAGEAVLEGLRPCDPCGYLEELVGVSGLQAALEGRGGLRARVVAQGTLRVGDPVVLLDT